MLAHFTPPGTYLLFMEFSDQHMMGLWPSACNSTVDTRFLVDPTARDHGECL